MKYYIYWTFKDKKIAIETKQIDFNNVIDSLKNNGETVFEQEAFTISKEIRLNEYCIRDAQKGELFVVGYTLEQIV